MGTMNPGAACGVISAQEENGMKTTLRLLLAGTLALTPVALKAEGNGTTPGDHTPVVHDRTPSAHDHGAIAPHK
jgi:hypothetical protein